VAKKVTRKARKKALCVGINDYGNQNAPEMGIPNLNLKGAVNDAHAWANLLVRHYNFSVADVTLLTDAQATRGNILKGLKDLVVGARSGDVLVFTNSSHGMFTPDVSGDEEEIEFDIGGKHFKGKFDEAICPYDYPKLIIDDELKEICDEIPDGVNLTIISDSCFSGTLTDFNFSKAGTDSGIPGELQYRALRHPQIVLLTASTDRQMSGDMPPDENKGRYDYHGFMTYNAIQTIKDAGYRLTYGELHERMLERIKTTDDPIYEKYRSQHPQLEASAQSKQLYIFTTKFKKPGS